MAIPNVTRPPIKGLAMAHLVDTVGLRPSDAAKIVSSSPQNSDKLLKNGRKFSTLQSPELQKLGYKCSKIIMSDFQKKKENSFVKPSDIINLNKQVFQQNQEVSSQERVWFKININTSPDNQGNQVIDISASKVNVSADNQDTTEE